MELEGKSSLIYELSFVYIFKFCIFESIKTERALKFIITMT